MLSNGRLVVGVGLGASTQHYPAYGLSREGRVTRFRENLEIMKRLLTEDKVTLDGRFSHLENIQMQPEPVQRPHPTLWFGGHAEAALRRAAELGDGYMARARHRWMFFWKTSNSCPPTFQKQSGCIWP